MVARVCVWGLALVAGMCWGNPMDGVQTQSMGADEVAVKAESPDPPPTSGPAMMGGQVAPLALQSEPTPVGPDPTSTSGDTGDEAAALKPTSDASEAVPVATQSEPADPVHMGGQVTVVPMATQSEPAPVDAESAPPRQPRIAVLLRGSSFRDYSDEDGGWKGFRNRPIGPCMESGKGSQMNGARSVVDKFILPMETGRDGTAGAIVDVVIQQTQCQGDSAHLNQELVDAYGSRVRAQLYTPRDTSQAKSMRALFDKYTNWSKSQKITHDAVYILRNDARWLKPYTEWNLHMNRINIASHCEPDPDPTQTSEECYNDVFWMVPGDKFPLLNGQFGKNGCFDESDVQGTVRTVEGGKIAAGSDSGHFCSQLEGLRPADVQVAWAWEPEHSVQEDSPYMQWIPKRKDVEHKGAWQLHAAHAAHLKLAEGTASPAATSAGTEAGSTPQQQADAPSADLIPGQVVPVQ